MTDLLYFQPGGSDFVPSVSGIITTIKFNGEVHQSRLGPTVELMNASIRFPMDHAPYRPKMARRLGVVEALQTLSGYFDPRHSESVAPGARYPFIMTHAYGVKIAHQLPKVIDQLKLNRGTRRAVIHIGKPEDGQEVDKPCIQSYQFNVRNGRLMMTVWARSWDAISGLPYDVIVANLVGQTVAQLLGVEPAHTTFMATSLHYYISDLERIVMTTGNAMNRPAKWTRIALNREFRNLAQVRSWAIDQLNNLSLWSLHGGLPRGIVSD